jgi:hypothetical protein
MATIGKVSAVFTASSSGLRTGVNQASRSMKQMESSVTSLRNQMRTLVAIQGSQLFGSISSGVSSAVRSLLQFGSAAAQTIDNQSKMAQQAGFTYAEFAGLGLAAELAGVGADQLSGAITRANVTIAKAAEGSKSAATALSRIGLSVDQLDGLSASEQFDKIAVAIGQLPAGAEQAAAAVAIFGRSGAQLLPLFQGGAEGIARARAEAEAFGLALTNTQATNVEAMNDAFTRAQSAIQGVIQQVVAYLAPAIESVTTAFSDLIGGIGGANIGQFIGEGILQGASFFAQIADQFVAGAGAVFEYFGGLGNLWSGIWEVADRVSQFLYGVGEFWRAVFLGIVAGITTVAGRLTTAAGQIAASIPGLGSTGAQLQAAGASLQQSGRGFASSAAQAFEASGEALSNAVFGRTEEAGEAVAGPITAAVDAAIQRARDAARTRDESVKQQLNITQRTEAQVQINAAPVKEAIKGIESRSAEGIREMFRIMRGDPAEDLAREQLEVQKEIARNTRDMGDDLDFDVIELAAAAGG